MNKENNKSVKFPVDRLLNLKEGEKEQILYMDLVKKGEQITFDFKAREGYDSILIPYREKIIKCIIQSLRMFGIERLTKSKDFRIPYAVVYLFMDEEELSASIKFFEIKNEDVIKNNLKFYQDLTEIFCEVVNKVNEDIDRYAELKDDNEIFEIREFTFIYSKIDNEWNYINFQRYADREIPEQKRDVMKLLNQGVAEKLLEMVGLEDIKDKDTLLIKFDSDGYSTKIKSIGTV